MVENRYAFESEPSALKNAVLVVNPNRLSDLFKIAAVSAKTQLFLETVGVAQLVLRIPAKKLLYAGKSVVADGFVAVRLPHSEEELRYMQGLQNAEVWEVTGHEDEGVMQVVDGRLLVIKQHAASQLIHEFWKSLPEKTKRFGLFNPFPLFRDETLAVFWKSKKEAIALIMERLRERYEEKRTLQKVPSTLVVTPNLDHLRMLYEEKQERLQEAYASAMLQTPDGYPPLVRFALQSIGYQIPEQITGVDLFMQIINTIGREGLPYTIYLVGGFGNVPYQARDYFISIYPNLRENFVGISTPQKGFLDKEEIISVIAKDIDAKKPDLVFAGMTAPVQEGFVVELMRRKVNFGIGFGIGRAIEILTGYQKKEPAILEKLHLSWVYRSVTGSTKEIIVRNRNRVIKDLKFAWKLLVS